ncbi:MAG: acyl-CoA thioesterase [Phenylobacterium sp.]
MSEHIFDLRGTHNPHRWYLPLGPHLCVGPTGGEFMFGGIGLAAAVAAMERTTGRPVVWATAQYLSYAKLGSVVDFDVWTPTQGKYNTQARVIGHVDDREIITVNAALGSRPAEAVHQWETMPQCEAPETSRISDRWRRVDHNDLHSHLEMREPRRNEAHNGEGGRSLIWIRPAGGYPVDAAMLAIMADHVPFGVSTALGTIAGGNSLDNTIRIRRIVPTEWVLCDIQIHGVFGGFAHGSMQMFARDGELMATGSQSLIVRDEHRLRTGPA